MIINFGIKLSKFKGYFYSLCTAGLSKPEGQGTVCSSRFSNQHQVQQYKSCLQSFLKFFVILKYHRCLWANIFDTDIYRCINTYIKVVYWAFLGIFMLLQMSVSRILADRLLWYIKTTKNLQKWIQTWFILLHMVLVWNVRVKFTKRAIVY